MITHTAANTDKDLSEILDLQQRNLRGNLTIDDLSREGFVTVQHSFSDLKKLNEQEQHQVIKEDGKVVGYILAMTEKSKNDIPVLIPMFELFQQVAYRGKPISSYQYMVVGQVCVAVNFRGKGLFDEAYAAYRERFSDKYEFAVTEIATANARSLKAHQRIGFLEVHRYTDEQQTEWSIVLWDWRAGGSVA